MKLLLIVGAEETYANVSRCLKPLGFEIIRYNHVIKAMDNIDEIDPGAIVISARDFTRHWKTFVQFVRNERLNEDCPVIILTGENFPLEECKKASFIGVNGIVNEALSNPEDIQQLHETLKSYKAVDERRRKRRLQAEPWKKIAFVFCHPVNNALVTGKVKNISAGGLLFIPDNSSMLNGITWNMELKDCSLRADDFMLSPACRIAKTGTEISLEFMSFPGDEQKTMLNYLEKIQ